MQPLIQLPVRQARRALRPFAAVAFLMASVLSTSCLKPPDPATVAAQNAAVAEPGTESTAQRGNVPMEAYEWKSVAIWGGGFVTGLAYSPVEQGILYARTDVGGAYRYDTKGKSWIPITDFLGLEQGNYYGIESFAADPQKADRVYIAAGMYTQDWAGTGAFMRSDDRGKTFKIFPVSFKMGGNELSRSNGERLAVDPNKTNILYFGSRRNGLWKSEDEAKTWTKMEFPVPDDKEKGLGLVFVVFDASTGETGKPTPTIYVASQVDGKIYHSQDAGKTWKPVPKQPETGFLPRRASIQKDGTLYVSYALGDSPYALRDGAVYRYEPKEQVWTNITPLKPKEGDTFGYGGISVDAQKPGTVIVATMDRWSMGAEIFRTTDSGKTWKPLVKDAVLGAGGVKHVYHHRDELGAPQWVGDIKINPFDSNEAMLVEGGGIWATNDLAGTDGGKPMHLNFHSKNIEEIVARDMISPPEGAPLVSVQMDTCGFVHDNVDESPQKGSFTNPTCASAEDIDYAGLKPKTIVRVGTHPWDGSKGPRGAISTDGGVSWKQFESEPQGCEGMGSVVVTADGKSILWAPRGARPAYSRDGGKTWTQSSGLPETPKTPDWAPWALQLASDKVNPKKLYAFDAPNGSVYVSTDGGATFEVTSKSRGNVAEYELQYGSIETVPGYEGHFWITSKEKLSWTKDSGKTFKTISGLDQAHGVGFGKAAPGKSYPAIYFAGTIDGVHGIFRSDNEGKKFVRINDDEHQYGGSTVITGDPRIYGRVYVATGGRGIVYGDTRAKK